MKKQFYSHIVSIEVLEPELKKTSISGTEKKELLEIAERSLHFAILDTVLSQLSESDKKIFLKHAHEEKHEELWKHLLDKEKTIEKKIRETGEQLIASLQEDIREMTQKNSPK